MRKRLFVHDLNEDLVTSLSPLPKGVRVFAADPAVHHCVGCFGCWLKTPGSCVMKDRAQKLPALLADSDQMVIVSRLVYGGFSPEIKAALDRSIGYIMPFFRFVNGEMHHIMRYDNPFQLTVHFYGNSSPAQTAIARRLVPANAVNLGAGSHHVFFHNSAETAWGAIE